MSDTVLVKRNQAGQWFWHRVNNDNHRLVATSGEPFESKEAATKAARRAFDSNYTIEVEEDFLQ
jgi:uncharacterized protein YegP (UPF0339 family)